MSGASLFDRVVMVDWSANSTPKRGRDSIWIGDSLLPVALNPATRVQAMSILDEAIGHATSDHRLLIGFDFSFGYPAGFAEALTGAADWRALWSWFADHVCDGERNRNDRLEVAAAMNEALAQAGLGAPFWGYPGRERTDALPRARPATYAPFDEFRLAEHRVRAAGHRPFSSWQLAYPGSVGSQMMLGIRALERLRRRHGEHVSVWPFESATAPVIFAEIWPSMFPLDTGRHPIRDAAQVLTMVSVITESDRAGTLQEWFDPVLTIDEHRVVVGEEGWTLGVR